MLRILVVDDEAQVRDEVGKILRDAGHHVVVVSNGQAALVWIEAGSEFDLVLTDKSMPDMGGVALIQKVKVLKPQMPCILMSAMKSEHVKMYADQAGADGYLVKSEIDNLPAKVAELMRV